MQMRVCLCGVFVWRVRLRVRAFVLVLMAMPCAHCASLDRAGSWALGVRTVGACGMGRPDLSIQMSACDTAAKTLLEIPPATLPL